MARPEPTCPIRIGDACSLCVPGATGPDLVPVMGPVHGALFVGLVLLVLDQRQRLGWSPRRTALALTVGSPFAHFFVRGTR